VGAAQFRRSHGREPMHSRSASAVVYGVKYCRRADQIVAPGAQTALQTDRILRGPAWEGRRRTHRASLDRCDELGRRVAWADQKDRRRVVDRHGTEVKTPLCLAPQLVAGWLR